jgi:hypothetical protein
MKLGQSVSVNECRDSHMEVVHRVQKEYILDKIALSEPHLADTTCPCEPHLVNKI